MKKIIKSKKNKKDQPLILKSNTFTQRRHRKKTRKIKRRISKIFRKRYKNHNNLHSQNFTNFEENFFRKFSFFINKNVSNSRETDINNHKILGASREIKNNNNPASKFEFKNIFPDVCNKNLINNNNNVNNQNYNWQQHDINPFKDHLFLRNEFLCPLSCEFDYPSINIYDIPKENLPDVHENISYCNDSINNIDESPFRPYSFPNDIILNSETYSANNRNNDININNNAHDDNGNANLITNRINLNLPSAHNNINLNNNNNHNDTNGNVNINFNINNILIDRLRRRRRARMDLYNPQIDKNLIRIVKKDLPKIKYKENNEPKCAICIEDFKKGQTIYNLHCSHIFHVRCLNKELKNRMKCPICRKELK